MTLELAFIVDPLEKLKAYKDSSIAMMREAQRRGHAVYATQRDLLTWRDGVVSARAERLRLTTDDASWHYVEGGQTAALSGYDAVFMRQDPPFDFEYVAATWLLERAQSAGARVWNDPRAIRDHSEKVAIAEFPQFIPTTLIAREAGELNAFIDELGDVILKPLDGMGGSQIFRVRRDDVNRNVIVETLTHNGARTVMAQRFIPEIAHGDKRVLIVGGKVIPYCLARIPKAGETRGNLAVGGRAVAQPISARDREIAEALAPILLARGLMIVGLDVIGDYLTEINVTSPTCFVEIAEQTGFNVAATLLDAVEASC